MFKKSKKMKIKKGKKSKEKRFPALSIKKVFIFSSRFLKKTTFFLYIKNCWKILLKKSNKFCKEKPAKTTKIFLKNKKTKIASIPVINTESFL